jgi:hypothetical protein
MVALWVWVPTLLVCVFTANPPATSRLVLVWPALFFIVGLTLARVGDVALRAFGRRAVLLGVPLVFGLGVAAVWNFRAYFDLYPRMYAMNWGTELGLAIREAGSDTETFVVSPPPVGRYSVEPRALTVHYPGQDLKPDEIPPQQRGHRDGLFAVSPGYQEALPRLMELYPGGQAVEHRNGRGDLLFTT